MIYFIKVYGENSSLSDKIIICSSSSTYIARETNSRQRDGHLVYDSYKVYFSWRDISPGKFFARYYQRRDTKTYSRTPVIIV